MLSPPPRAAGAARFTLQQLETHVWEAANILRGKTAGQDYLSLMFYRRLCDQWECEADDAIAELERQQGRAFSEQEKGPLRPERARLTGVSRETPLFTANAAPDAAEV